MKKTIIYLLTFLLFISITNAGITVTPNSAKTDIIYAGETSIVEGSVENTNNICHIESCACSPPSEYLESCSIATPIEDGQDSDMSIILKAPKTGPGIENLKLTVTCKDETSKLRVPCMGLSSEDGIELQLRWEWCGDTKCKAEKETCSSCPEDCGKCDGKSCEEASECFGKYCVHNVCSSKPFIIGDNYCDEGETCDNSPEDCEEALKCKPEEIAEETAGAETVKQALWEKYKLPLIIAGAITIIIIISFFLGKSVGSKGKQQEKGPIP